MISSRGYWMGLEAQCQHIYDSELSKGLLDFFKENNAKNLVDLGCGMGDYVAFFNKNGLNADGFDGNPNTPELTNQECCKVLDLSKEFEFEIPYDWVMSLEVGEHLPNEYEDIFINNLHKNNKYGIVLSWAIEGQGGDGHVNEKNNKYIKEKFLKLGYVNDIESENKLRECSTLFWFKNTIMVFKKT